MGTVEERVSAADARGEMASGETGVAEGADYAAQEDISWEAFGLLDEAHGPRSWFKSVEVLSSAALGLYLGWQFIICFSTKPFFAEGATFGMEAWAQVVSFGCYVGSVLVCIIFRRLFSVDWRCCAPWTGLAMLVASFVLAWSTYLPEWQPAFVLVIVSSALNGVSSAFLFVGWAEVYGPTATHPTQQIALALVVSCVVTLAALLAPGPVGMIVFAAVPLASGLLIGHAAAQAPAFEQEFVRIRVFRAVSSEVQAYQLPWRFTLGLAAMGIAYGLAFGYVFEYFSRSFEIAISCLLVNGVVALILLLFVAKTRRNFGYGTATAFILPLAGFAQCMIAILRTDMLVVSFSLMRMAYVLFTVIIWLQLPGVYRKVRSIRVFLLACVALDGGAFIGVVARALLALEGFSIYEFVCLATMGFLLVALTLAFLGKSRGNVWDLMPRPIARTGRFRIAAQRMGEDFGLTNREIEIMCLVGRGRNGTYVQEKLFISKSTFQTHMRNLYKKLDVHSNQELLDVIERYIDQVKDE